MVHRPASLRVKPQSNLKTPPKSIQTRAKSVGNPWTGLNAKKGCSNKLQVITSPNCPTGFSLIAGVSNSALSSGTLYAQLSGGAAGWPRSWDKCWAHWILRPQSVKRKREVVVLQEESGKIGLHHIVPRCSSIYICDIYIYMIYIYIYMPCVCRYRYRWSMCIHTYVYIYILYIILYIHVRIHVYMFTCIHVFMYIYIYAYIPTYIHTYIHACMHAYIHIHTYTHRHRHTDTQTHRHTHTHIYIYT